MESSNEAVEEPAAKKTTPAKRTVKKKTEEAEATVATSEAAETTQEPSGPAPKKRVTRMKITEKKNVADEPISSE